MTALPDDALDREVLDQIAERLAARMTGIVPERVYPPDEAALLIGLRGERASKTIREIPAVALPTVSISPGGKLKGYYGRDLIRYIHARRDEKGPELDAA